MQQRFGTPLNIEKEGLARLINALPITPTVGRKRYVCFRSAQEMSPDHRRASYQDLSDLFLFGRLQEGLLQADIASASSTYVIRPKIIEKIKSEIAAGRTLISLFSPLGHGKTVLVRILAAELAQENAVFIATRNQDNFIDELRDIVSIFKAPIIIIDDFYKYSRHHAELSRFTGAQVRFILTARLSVHEPRREELLSQFLNHNVVDIRIGELIAQDAKSLVPLINQAGMWGSLSDRSDELKAKQLLLTGENGFQGNFADILVGLMSSSEMIARVTKELKVLKSLSLEAYEVVLLSIYLEFTNNHIDEFIIDQTLMVNLGALNGSPDISNLFRLFFNPLGGGNGYFAGSIFAKYAMEKICDHSDLVDVIEKSAYNLSGSYPIYEELRLVLVDLLRFNYLKVIASGDHRKLQRIRDLYSSLSSSPNLNRDDLFWNAFGMCERALSNFDAAVKHFRTSISYAKLRGQYYVPYHAQNQLIVCLLERGVNIDIDNSTAYSNLREVLDLLLVQADDERTHGRGQAFAWHKELISFLELHFPNFNSAQSTHIFGRINKYVAFILRNVSNWERRPHAAMTVRKLQSFLANNPT